MTKVFTFEMPDGVDVDSLPSELAELVSGAAQVDLRRSAKSGSKGRLGQIDHATWELVVRMLDTKAAAAVAQSVMGAITGYLFAKTGKKPDTREGK